MRKIFTFLVLICAGSILVAQTTFSATQTSIVIQGDPNDNVDFADKIDVQNITGTFLKLTWERFENTLPNGWQTSVCDKSTCYPPATNSEDLLFSANGYNYVNVHFYPNGTAGTGNITIHVYNPADPTDEIDLDFTGTTEALEVDGSFTDEIKVYPNPAGGEIYIKSTMRSLKNTEWAIFDLSGKKLMAGIINPMVSTFKMGVETLESGIYIVQVVRESGEVVNRKFVKE